MEDGKKKKKTKSKINFATTGILLICAAVICLLISLMYGKTTVTNIYGDEEERENLICESHITAYPLFSYDNSDSKTLKINVIFEADKIASISLIYKLNYNNEAETKKSESVNHGSLNTLSQNEGLGPDAFEAKYSKLSDGLQLSLFASGEEITTKALKYFMLEGLTPSYTKEGVKEIYASQGLNCEVKK